MTFLPQSFVELDSGSAMEDNRNILAQFQFVSFRQTQSLFHYIAANGDQQFQFLRVILAKPVKQRNQPTIKTNRSGEVLHTET